MDAVGTSGMQREKKAVALNSIIAAVAITLMKVVVGIGTGSLGILSEAAHSGLDLVAAAITYFSVRVSDKPADADHQYGHGRSKLLGLLETGLLLLTCIWMCTKPAGGYFSFRRDRAHCLGIPRHGHRHGGGLLAFTAAAAHRRQV